jgi:predicted ATP-dependent protease
MTLPQELPPESLRWRCDPASLGFETTDGLAPRDDIIGQERATRAIALGLEIDSVGYNIFITGLVGTGRTTTIKKLLEELDKGTEAPDDLCYVHNFKNPDAPSILRMPAGSGCSFQKAMDRLLENLSQTVPKIFQSESFREQRRRVEEDLREHQKRILKEFEARVKERGFQVVQLQMGFFMRSDLVPVRDGTPIEFKALDELVEKGELSRDEYEQIQEEYRTLTAEMQKVLVDAQRMEEEIGEAIKKLEREAVSPILKGAISRLRDDFGVNERVKTYLDEVLANLTEDLQLFKKKEEEDGPPEVPDPLFQYRINVLVDNTEVRGRPVVVEDNPSYRNLFGTIERGWDPNRQWRTDFTMIKAGSFLRADGGYLVLNAFDVLTEPGVWTTLKRALRNRRLEIRSFDQLLVTSVQSLNPEPVETTTKVVMIGDAYIYGLLFYQDEDFQKIFKIKGDFDSEMTRTDENAGAFARVIKKIVDDEKLLPFDSKGVAGVLEYGSRLAESQRKLSTRFTQIKEILVEASYWARKEGKKKVSDADVDRAIREKIHRFRLAEDKLLEHITEGTLLIDTEGAVVGQVNGLAVYDVGDYSFGKPARITATTSIGSDGVVNIEREVEYSGASHDKGVLILSGWLRDRFAQDKPLSMEASICFEQSYGGVDGDSASSTEIYAILSSLSGIPLRQDLAVTGSVNQKGVIQPIGAVNEKIEGFYDVCKARGLTGTQGVLIPPQNVRDLMLRKDVIESVAEGKFHVYPASTIEEGIEILTTVEAGAADPSGRYPEDSVLGRANRRLQQLADTLKAYD